MKATEIFAEQLLIGLMVLIIGVLLCYGANPKLPFGTNNVLGDFFFGFLVIGGAYIVGMVYDRVADTLLQDLERHNQLQFALKNYAEKGKNLVFVTDPFQLGRMRIRLLAKGKELASHADYLRSRMRLTRATATLMPALFLGLLLLQIEDIQWQRTFIVLVILVVYGLVLIMKIAQIPKSPPKTDKLEELPDYIMLRSKKGKSGDSANLRLLLRDLFCDPAVRGLILLTFVGFIIAGESWEGNIWSLLLLLAYPFFGFLLSLLIGGVWWRISETYLKFHLGFDKHVD